MEPTTSTSAAIVLSGNDGVFVEAVTGALPEGHDSLLFVVGTENGSGAGGAFRTVAIDALPATLEPFGDRVIGVLNGSRGAAELSVAHAVKRLSGTVIALVETGAKPDRAASAFIDLALSVRELPGALAEILAEPLLKGDGGDDEQLLAFLRVVRQRTGIDFAQYKMATIRRRLQRLMIAANAATLDEFAHHLQKHPEEYQRLVHEFLIKITDFFRDEQLFEYLRSEILPELVNRARAENGELRIWSAGCATGEEAYSIGILLAEIYGSELENAKVKIFATDLDESAIAFARHGVYPRSALGAMPPEWIERYFVESARGFEVRKRIRTITVFGQHDLGARAPFPRTDLVLCRNVLIYFTKELQQRTLQLFAFSLRESSYLVLGKSETISPAPEYFRPVHTPFRTFQRYGERVLIPPPRAREAYAMVRDGADGDARGTGESSARTAEPPRAALYERFGSSLFTGSTGYAIVGRRYDVVAINTEGRRLLGIAGLGVGEDLVHLLHGGAASALRAMIDRCHAGAEETGAIDMADSPLAAHHRIRVTVSPERRIDGVVPNGFVMVRVEDVSDLSRAFESATGTLAERDERIGRLEADRSRIGDARDAFAVANQELSTANLELRSLNEHLQISVEEAESSTEEIETLNEEMQATNEELETLNEELQATIEELNTTNDELHVRGLELQAALEERDRAIVSAGHVDSQSADIFAEMPVPVVHYRPNGSIDKMNDAFLALLEAYGDPLPLRTETPDLAPAPLERAARGQAFEETWRLGDGAAPRTFDVLAKPLYTDGRGTLVILTERGG